MCKIADDILVECWSRPKWSKHAVDHRELVATVASVVCWAFGRSGTSIQAAYQPVDQDYHRYHHGGEISYWSLGPPNCLPSCGPGLPYIQWPWERYHIISQAVNFRTSNLSISLPHIPWYTLTRSLSHHSLGLQHAYHLAVQDFHNHTPW